MNKQELLDYTHKMSKDEAVFAIIFSKRDVKQRFSELDNMSLLPLEKDIFEALQKWEDGMDLSCSSNLADAFDDLCQELLDNERRL